jgi:hypothetical protein
MFKIRLLGNMNNNNFSILRYFRALGVDCQLFLYKDECIGSFSHFHPSQDTFNYEDFRPFITRIPISHHPISLLPAFLRIPIDIFLYISHILGNSCRPYVWKNSDFSCLNELFSSNAIVVGSGLAPAISWLNGFKLTAFYPYSTGVEYLLANPEVKRHSRNPILFLVYLYVSHLQAKGIKSAGLVLNAEIGITESVLNSLGVRTCHLPIPMYFREDPPTFSVGDQLDEVIRIVERSQFSILHFSRLHWVQPIGISSRVWQQESKNNMLFFEAFSGFVKSRSACNVRLVVLSYGKDVDATRRFLIERDIEKYVTMLPVQPRKNIGLLLQKCSISVGEFSSVDQTIFGGTTWEALANGCPIIQSCPFQPDIFYESFGFPLPPLISASSVIEISESLCRCYDQPDLTIQLGISSRRWFDTYNGFSLAESWLEALTRQLGVEQAGILGDYQ